MLDQLLEIRGSLRGQIVHLERSLSDGSAVLDVVVEQSDRPRPERQRWRIEVRGVLEFVLRSHEIPSISLVERHPVLWGYDQPQVELYFQGRVENIHATLGRVQEAHSVAGRGWIPFGAFFNDGAPLHALLAMGSGLFATGPLSVIRAYQEVLEAAGLRCSALPESSAGLDPIENLRALILGTSYVIATEFTAEWAEGRNT